MLADTPATARRSPAFVITGSALGSLFEWYDFFLYGALASEIARQFFAGVDEATGFILALATFGAGFAVRPLGALVFGRIGDIVGRKNTFLATMAIMGASTFLIGILPGYATIGIAAPLALVILRMLQGLSVGGEYGGASIYVAEHAPPDRRGLYTSWLNATAPAGLVLALAIIIACRLLMSEQAFANWGWRLPFLVSIVLLGVSLWIRLQLEESPVFARMKAEGAIAKAPYAEAFGQWKNLKHVLAVFGWIAGTTSYFYAAHFYSLYFLQRTLKVDALSANVLVMTALVIAIPTYLLWGWLSDRYGRKLFLAGGTAIAALTLFPAYHLLTEAANPALASAQRHAPVVVAADPAACSFQFDPLGTRRFDTRDCDVARFFLSRAGVSYRSVRAPAGAVAEIRIGDSVLAAPDPRGMGEDDREEAIASFQARGREALLDAGYPSTADPERINVTLVVAIVAFMAIVTAMYFAPMAAFLVELFPARIRYTALSAPYHFATGWIGGFLPATAFAIVTATGDIYSGLWYPVAFGAVGALICAFFLPETHAQSA
jgi:MFS family permease